MVVVARKFTYLRLNVKRMFLFQILKQSDDNAVAVCFAYLAGMGDLTNVR